MMPILAAHLIAALAALTLAALVIARRKGTASRTLYRFLFA
jgi:uncharacterized membrane protein